MLGLSEVESRGEFTLDPRQAIRHLRHQQLPGPDHYLLKLVQAAVAAGASEIQARVGWFGITIDLTLPQPLPLDELSRHLFKTESHALRYLAVGVNAALSTVRTVALEQGGHRHVLTRKSQWEESAPERPGLRVSLTRNRWDCSYERRLLAESCCWCPVPFHLDGKPVQIPHWGGSLHLIQSYVPGTALSAPSSSRALRPPRIEARLAGRRIACDMVLALSGSASAEASVSFVAHGVIVSRRMLKLGAEGVQAVVGADELPTDLGGFELTDGRALEERIAAIRVEVEKMSRRT